MSRDKSPIFIVGAMRSGTTLLRLVLDSHPRIAVPDETGFMRAAGALESIPNWRHGKHWYTRLGVTSEEMDQLVSQFFRDLFERHMEKEGKHRWGEKTPFHVWHLEKMSRLFPDAVFVAIVRHPGAVVASLMKWSYGLSEAIDEWGRSNLELVRVAAELGGRFSICRYEDLVVHPRPTLEDLMAFLEEPWSDELLAHGQVQRDKGAPRVVAGGTRPAEPISADRVDGWRSRLEAAQLAQIAERTEPLAQILGYTLSSDANSRRGGWWREPDGTVGCDPGSAHPAYLLSGTELSTLWERVASAPPSERPLDEDPLAESTVEDLIERLRRAESSLRRLRARRAVRVVDALRQAQRANSLAELRRALHGLSRPSR